MRYINWANLVIAVLGGIIISNLLSLSGISIAGQLPASMFIWFAIIIPLILIFLLVYKYIIRKGKIRVKVDERERAISDRSARNGFIATYLTLFILLTLETPPDAKTLLITIATSLFVFLISFIFYYYRRA